MRVHVMCLCQQCLVWVNFGFRGKQLSAIVVNTSGIAVGLGLCGPVYTVKKNRPEGC